jgi:FK506-binding protein 1
VSRLRRLSTALASSRLGIQCLAVSPRCADGKTFPKKGDTLTMHYVGTLKSNGRKFDSSRDRGSPFKFDVSANLAHPSEGTRGLPARIGRAARQACVCGAQIGRGMVIRGWDEGVMGMSLGETCKLDITADFGYGARGAGGVIPPNADLIFEVELLKIN